MAAAAGRSARKPFGEVIMEFADGGTYIQDRLQQSIADQERVRIGWEVKRRRAEAERQKKEKELKEEDVEFLVKSLTLPSSTAISLLIASSGSVDQCLQKMSEQPSYSGSASRNSNRLGRNSRMAGLDGEKSSGVNGVEKKLEELKV